jgi:hypothetical protein
MCRTYLPTDLATNDLPSYDTAHGNYHIPHTTKKHKQSKLATITDHRHQTPTSLPSSVINTTIIITITINQHAILDNKIFPSLKITQLINKTIKNLLGKQQTCLSVLVRYCSSLQLPVEHSLSRAAILDIIN